METTSSTTPRYVNWLGVAAVLLLGLTYLRPVWDGDYFWHVHTGQWILENWKLPITDPFKFTYENIQPGTHEYELTKLHLRGYWLGDILFYWMNYVTGPGGMVALRAIVYAALVGWCFLCVRREGSGPLGYLLVVLLGVMLGYYPNERPQLFSYLFFLLLIHWLDSLPNLEGKDLRKRGILLSGLMLLWANVHGAYILGLLVLGAYAVGYGVDVLLKRRTLRLPEFYVVGAAFLVTLVNPNGWGFLFEYIQQNISTKSVQQDTVNELVSTIRALTVYGKFYMPYWTFLALTALIVLWRILRIKIWHLLVIAGVAYLSLSALRHMIWLLLLLPLVAPYARGIPWNKITAALCALILAGGLVIVEKRDMLNFREDRHFPKGAMAFLQNVPTEGNLFNFYDWGGYVSYYLPGRKIFIDGRSTLDENKKEHDAVMMGMYWQNIFYKNNVNTVVVPGVVLGTDRPFPIVYALAQSPDWALIYWDESALVFVRYTLGNRPAIDKYLRPSREIEKQFAAMKSWCLRL